MATFATECLPCDLPGSESAHGVILGIHNTSPKAGTKRWDLAISGVANALAKRRSVLKDQHQPFMVRPPNEQGSGRLAVLADSRIVEALGQAQDGLAARWIAEMTEA